MPDYAKVLDLINKRERDSNEFLTFFDNVFIYRVDNDLKAFHVKTHKMESVRLPDCASKRYSVAYVKESLLVFLAIQDCQLDHGDGIICSNKRNVMICLDVKNFSKGFKKPIPLGTEYADCKKFAKYEIVGNDKLVYCNKKSSTLTVEKFGHEYL